MLSVLKTEFENNKQPYIVKSFFFFFFLLTGDSVWLDLPILIYFWSIALSPGIYWLGI